MASPSALVLFVTNTVASTASRTHVRDDRETPLLVARDGGNLLVILGTDQSLMPATNWHDGQISCCAPNPVNRDLVSRTRCGA
jgi:hypothetical protein